MRELSGNDRALPPLLFNDDTFCGDFDAFMEAVEVGEAHEFLKLPKPEAPAEAE
eukprot:m.81161 g.81161  ORF g.81161 m.81161 type:complete len:54 (-) comp8218_c1_seq4:52-213(-)